MLNLAGVITSIVSNFFTDLATYFPQFLAGLLVLIVGMFIANLAKQLTLGAFDLLQLDKLAKHAKFFIINAKVWPQLVAELFRWSILILFLVAAVETWGIRTVGEVLNQLLLYLPNVFVAVFVGLVGIVAGNFIHDIVKHSAKGLGSNAANSLATLARYSVLVFTGLIVLHQLGVATNLIQILFTGLVLMLALAGGLAFGLGGQDLARQILNDLYKKLKK